MEPRSSVRRRSQKSEVAKVEGTNWMLVAGSALLSSIFIHIGCKFKQALEARRSINDTLKDNGNSTDRRMTGTRHSQPIVYTFEPVEDGYFNCNSGTEHTRERKNPSNCQILKKPEDSLPLVTFPTPEYNQEDGMVWASSPKRIELPAKSFHHPSGLESPCASDSGSDVYAKREVIQKLRQQLKRRDEMISEMQDQVAELQNALINQVSHGNNMQSQLDSANRDLFDLEREIQRLRKVIADHCASKTKFNGRNLLVTALPSEEINGHANGYVNGDSNPKIPKKLKGDGVKIEMLKREIGELKEVIEGKEFLVQSYKEQKSELTIKIRELQKTLDSQLPNIL